LIGDCVAVSFFIYHEISSYQLDCSKQPSYG
jgi:hypothetical protein